MCWIFYVIQQPVQGAQPQVISEEFSQIIKPQTYLHTPK